MGIVKIVAVHVQDIQLSVPVEIMHREVHRAIHRRKARQYAVPSRKIPFPVILEQYNPLITLPKQRDNVRIPVPCQVPYLEPDGAWTGIQHLPRIVRAIVAIQRQAPTVVAEFADEKLVPAIPIKVEWLDKHRPEQRVDQGGVELQ